VFEDVEKGGMEGEEGTGGMRVEKKTGDTKKLQRGKRKSLPNETEQGIGKLSSKNLSSMRREWERTGRGKSQRGR